METTRIDDGKPSSKRDLSGRLLWFFICVPILLATFSWSQSVDQSLLRSVLPSWTLSLWTTSSVRPMVEISHGSILGTVVEDSHHPVPIHAFLGIPYAKPPIGDLRFARPVPASPFTDIFDASKYGSRCPGKQLIGLGKGPDSHSEDCLTVNVFRQSNTSGNGTRAPVAVYFHGGAFNRGTARMHDTASMIAWSPKPIVGVSFNYRLGAMGFLNSKVTAEEGLLNVGLHDQILLLQWVKQNIAAFGGDPDDVTVIGLSAGAHSIGHHLMNINSNQQLFHKVVMESGGPTSRALHPYDSNLHEQQFRQLLLEVRCDQERDRKILDCLRAVSSEDLIVASTNVFERWNPSVRWAWQPVIDDEIITRRPLDAWKSNNWNKVPLLTGFNHNEGTMYVPKTISHATEFENFFSTLLPQLSGSDLLKIQDLYPDPSVFPDSRYVETRNISVGPQYKRTEAAYGQYAYVCPVRQTVHLATAASDSSTGKRPAVYLYHWDLNRTVLGGANHGDQMWYETMDPNVRAISSMQNEIAGYFHGYITSFILTGNPNTVRGCFGDRPEWKTYHDQHIGSGYPTMIFGEGNDERAGGDEKGISARFIGDRWAQKECDFWWEMTGTYED